MTERGDADHELIDENERDRFAGTSADPEAGTNGAGTATPTGEGAGSRTEFEQGREVGHEEERGGRFDRTDEPADKPGSRRA
jgi:hypothetical protein